MKKETAQKKIRIDHVFRMTDDTGIIHHSNKAVPDHTKGYKTVDNARALIVAVKLFDRTRTKRVESLINRYIAFLSSAQNENGTFRNSMGSNREFVDEQGTEECFARCLWALCYTYSDHNISHDIKKKANELLSNALGHCMKLKSSRAISYVIIGLSFLNQDKTNAHILKLAYSLVDHYIHYNEGEWHWFEDKLSCCNASLPWALLIAFKVTKEERFLKVGLESLLFLESKTFNKGYFKPIGINGIFSNGHELPQSDELTMEASETTAAYIEAYQLTNNMQYIDKAKTSFYWYMGKNSKNHTLMDFETSGCHDGFEFGRLNPNQGAESIISFWSAYLDIMKYFKTAEPAV